MNIGVSMDGCARTTCAQSALGLSLPVSLHAARCCAARSTLPLSPEYSEYCVRLAHGNLLFGGDSDSHPTLHWRLRPEVTASRCAQ